MMVLSRGIYLLVVATCLGVSYAQTLFNPSASSTFHQVDQFAGAYTLQFQDGSEVGGARSRDQFAIGTYLVNNEFVAATSHSGAFFGSGVLGLGLRDISDSRAFEPILYSLADPAHNTNPLPKRMFTLALTPAGGSLYLGGFDPTSMIGPPNYVSMPLQCLQTGCASTAYNVVIDQITFGVVDSFGILYTNQASSSRLVATLDSGTTALTLPSAGSDSIFSLFQKYSQQFSPSQRPFFNITIGGASYIIEYEDFAPFGPTNMAVASYSADPSLLILGDPFFRAVVVVHDLSTLTNVNIGLAPRNRSAVSTSRTRSSSVMHLPLSRVVVPSSSTQRHRRDDPNNIPVTTPDQAVYMTSVTIGKPAQGPFALEVDTASPVTLVFSEAVPLSQALIIMFSCVAILGAALILGCIIVAVRYYRRPVNNEPLLKTDNDPVEDGDFNVWSERDNRMVL